ncbi:hypothetical protein IQ250_13650 [Pseudanabaenaceae cyanobacterium LEGE 13415]|nr:hypothetical protein [Pseudanabaenaceae cyanobacterium LEGE 13415]
MHLFLNDRQIGDTITLFIVSRLDRFLASLQLFSTIGFRDAAFKQRD